MYFVVYPGGNYKDIQMHVAGAKATSIVSSKLKIQANWESTTFEKPQMYQYTISGSNVISPVNIANADWVNMGGNTYQFTTISSFNSSLPLIVQIKQANAVTISTPGLKWSTYFGGTQYEWLSKTHTDASDNLYIAGYSNSANQFPQAQGVVASPSSNGDAALVKFNSQGQIQWSTFVGGSGNDEFYDFDFTGNSIYCVGHTSTNNLTTVPKTGATTNATYGGGSWDGFICELALTPGTGLTTLNWLTYFGGNGDEELNACKFDAQGNFFVVGASASTNMTPMGGTGAYAVNFNAAQLSALTPLSTDGIIAKFNTSSLQSWFTFYGTDALGANSNSYAADYFYGLTISGSDVYVCGKAGGSNLPNSVNAKSNSGNFDGILVRFTTAGVLATNSAKFTAGNISNYAVKTLWGDVYAVGQSAGAMTTVNSGLYYFQSASSGATDACFSVHSQNLATTLHNSYLGGDGDDAAYDLQFTSNNLFYIAGGTNSTNFPTSNIYTAMYNSNGGPDPSSGIWTNDNFVTCIQKNNVNLVWSTYLGSKEYPESLGFPKGLDFQQPRAITTIAVDSQNRLHALGYSNSINTFPLDDGQQIPYFQGVKSGGTADDATITRFDVFAVNSIVGIQDFENTAVVFGLYPNPTSKSILITHTELINEDLRYAVYDLGGKKLAAGNLKSSEVKDIDVSFLQAGVYIINISNGRKTYSNKFVKTDR